MHTFIISSDFMCADPILLFSEYSVNTKKLTLRPEQLHPLAFPCFNSVMETITARFSSCITPPVRPCFTSMTSLKAPRMYIIIN